MLFNTFYWSRLDNCALIKDSIFETITPVNTFRIVFNHYLGGEFELLPNRSYFSPVPDQYKFEQVTSRCQT